jgi:hypothetical protein
VTCAMVMGYFPTCKRVESCARWPRRNRMLEQRLTAESPVIS